MLLFAATSPAQEIAKWSARPVDWKGAAIADGQATMTADKWSFLIAPDEHAHVELSANVTIAEEAKQFQFLGSGWSAWPPADWGDQGFEAALLVRSTKDSGFRVQLSHEQQTVALVKYPDGGYLRVVSCDVKLNQPHAVLVTAQEVEIVVRVDGRERIRFRDSFLPLTSGGIGIGTSSAARVVFDQVVVKPLPNVPTKSVDRPHVPSIAVRKWLGERQWVFDGDEPILELHNEQDPNCFAKLKPGYKPQLTFDSHWGLENQGAFPDAASKWTEPVVSGCGESLKATWSARNVKDRFVTRSTLAVGFDSRRGTYTYDIDSELEVLPGEPFQFRYGFDFEHHTPLDPFRWQYLIAKRKSG